MILVQKTMSGRAWADLLILSLIWGASFLSVHVALAEIGPLTSVAHRTFWAMLILWGYVAIRSLPLPRRAAIWGAFVIMGLLNNVIPFSLMAWGQLHIETGLTAIMNASTAIFGAITAALFLTDERLTLRKAVGVGLGFLGVATAIGLQALTQFDLRVLGPAGGAGWGDQLCFCGGLGAQEFGGPDAAGSRRRHVDRVQPDCPAPGVGHRRTKSLWPCSRRPGPPSAITR